VGWIFTKTTGSGGESLPALSYPLIVQQLEVFLVIRGEACTVNPVYAKQVQVLPMHPKGRKSVNEMAYTQYQEKQEHGHGTL